MQGESSSRHSEDPLGPLAQKWVDDLHAWYTKLQNHFGFDPSDLPSNLRNNIDKWKKRLALMIVLALCIMARGAEVCACLREGLAWVRHDGTQVRAPLFAPSLVVDPKGVLAAPGVKGMLLLLSSRKNRQATPTWVPVISSTAITLLARHIRWLDRTRGPMHEWVSVPSTGVGETWWGAFVRALNVC